MGLNIFERLSLVHFSRNDHSRILEFQTAVIITYDLSFGLGSPNSFFFKFSKHKKSFGENFKIYLSLGTSNSPVR
jgi:hypothetical protein